FSGWRVNGGGI
ncbi:Multidrug export protein EmrA, partial [Haemophilus influenzae]